ncbi:hypothetical protein Ahy_B10g104244 [Arachis hypogaea]|uniref:Aminotransferase-like plant mobile domain-containing protein n=1 Tax=Arachis hypogaea TaxID=3818 RepID=A0A444X505_ARAHY|nr:hypothetical protein Ahy_B10g104244 [Arachis hypogaea]
MLMCDHLKPPDPYNQIVELQLRETGFYYVSQIRVIKCQSAMINALIERWWSETHTFYFSVGECAVTLEDVAVIIGLPTNGLPVTGPTMSSFEALEAECLHQFGIAPRKTDYKSGAAVHWKFLPLLRNCGGIIQFSWGSACLAHLYRSLCRATRVDCKEMDGPLTLLFVWQAYGIRNIDPDVISLDIRHNSSVPNQEQDLGASHGEVLTGPKNQDWVDTHSLWVMQWTNRESRRSSTTITTTTGTGTGTDTDTHPSDYYSASVPVHQQYWGSPQFEYGEQPSFSQLLGFMASGSHHSHLGNYVDIPTDHQAHSGGITPARRSLDLRPWVRTSSDNSGARMSIDSSRSAEATGGIIQSENPRRIPMTLIHESNRAVYDETDNYLVDHPDDEDEDEDEDEGEDEDEDDDDAVDEDPASSAGTATSEKGKGYNLRADPPRRSANRYTPSAFNRIAKKCRKLYKDMKWAPRK